MWMQTHSAIVNAPKVSAFILHCQTERNVWLCCPCGRPLCSPDKSDTLHVVSVWPSFGRRLQVPPSPKEPGATPIPVNRIGQPAVSLFCFWAVSLHSVWKNNTHTHTMCQHYFPITWVCLTTFNFLAFWNCRPL